MSTTRTDAAPSGGWLNAMAKGTAAAYFDVEPDPSAPDTDPSAPDTDLKVTPRMAAVLKALLKLGGGLRPVDVADATDIPTGWVSPVLARLEAHRWARSERAEGGAVRRYTLTAAGVDGARDALGVEPGPVPEPPVATGAAATEDAPVATGDDGERVWTMAELEAADPDLAAAVRRRLTGR